MPLLSVPELLAALRPGERLLGIDPGRRTIGLALSDVGRRLASPYGQIRRGKLAVNAAEIAAIAARQGAAGLVVGLPLGMEGEFGPAAQAARDWARDLSHAAALPAAMWDERLTTADTHQMLIETAGMGRARRARIVDRLAAARILQSFLDAAA